MARLKYLLIGFAAFAALSFSTAAWATKSPFTGTDLVLGPQSEPQAVNPEGDEADAEGLVSCMTRAAFDVEANARRFKLFDFSSVNSDVTDWVYQDSAGLYHEFTLDLSYGAADAPFCEIGTPSKGGVADQPAPEDEVAPVVTPAAFVTTPAAPVKKTSPDAIPLDSVQDVPGRQTDQLSKVNCGCGFIGQ